MMQMSRAILHSLKGNNTSPIPRQSLGAAVVERLRDKILGGELLEGEQLRQDAIAAEFQISRIPVREALSHLAAEGLVTLVANRGAVVSALSPEEIMELFETRAVLECYMLRCAIPGMRPEDFQRAEDILRQYEESLERDSEVESLGALKLEFPFRSLRNRQSSEDAGPCQKPERQLRSLHPPAPCRDARPAPCRPGAPRAS